MKFEGFSDVETYSMTSDGRSNYCGYAKMTDDNRPENQDDIDL